MTSSPTKTDSPLCSTEEEFRSACFGAASFVDAGKPYCLFHFPSSNKSKDFRDALNKRLEKKNYNFRGVWFPYELKLSRHSFETNAVFEGATFIAQPDFSRTIFRARADFSGAVFVQQARFNSATFTSRANFDQTVFCGNANFDRATFGARVGFNSACFARRASFESATFHERANFGEARFKGEVNFRLTNFKDYVRFAGTRDDTGAGTPAKEFFGEKSLLDLREVKIDKPELVSFNTLTLRPFWFVEVNASKFDFSNVTWRLGTLAEEIDEINKAPAIVKSNCEEESYGGLVRSPYTPLGIAAWNLAVNAEENHRYEEASDFRYLAMEARRREHPGFLHWLYFAGSGYGERIIHPLLVLAGILLLFACLYAATVGDKAGPLLRLWRGVSYSASVMTLQKPEPPPPSTFVQVLVTVETILGPVQAALFALAIRRRFLR